MMLYLVPMHRFWSPLSTLTKISTINFHVRHYDVIYVKTVKITKLAKCVFNNSDIGTAKFTIFDIRWLHTHTDFLNDHLTPGEGGG